MPKLTLNDINNISGNPTSAEQLLNANFTAIEEAVENTLSRDGTRPNTLEAALDANSQRIINLPYARTNSEPVTLAQVMAIVSGGDWTGGIGVPAIVFYQDVEPTATAAGQVWVKPSDLTIYIWTGEEWVRQEDPNLQLALDQATSALAAAELASTQALTAADLATTSGSLANQAIADVGILSPRLVAVEQEAAAVSLAIIELENETGSLAAQINTVSSDVGDLTAVVQSENLARIAGDTALAATINTLQASNAQIYIQPLAPVAGVGGVPNPIPDGSFWYDSDDGNSAYRWLDGAWQNVDNAEVAGLSAMITSEETARIAGDTALAADIDILQSQRAADYALIQSNNTALVNQDSAFAVSLNNIVADFGNLTSIVNSNRTAQVNGDVALASDISIVSANLSSTNGTLSNLSATVASYNQARIDGDTAIAGSLSLTNSTVGSLSTTVSQHTTSINGIGGAYTIKVDANGYVTGFGLASTNDNRSPPTSTFTVLADNFRIVTPGSSPISPFYTVGGVTYIRDVRIDSATIGTATIGTVNIAGRAVSDIQPAVFNFNGASGPSVTPNVYVNLTTSAGTAAVTASSIAVPGSLISIRGYFNARRAGSEGENALLRIRRNDGVILPGTLNIRLGADYIIYAWEWIDTAPVSTSHTYNVQITRPGGTGLCGDWYDVSLIATICKR